MFPLSKLKKKKKGKGCEGVKWSETKLSESILHPLCAVDQRCPPTDTLADKKLIAKEMAAGMCVRVETGSAECIKVIC